MIVSVDLVEELVTKIDALVVPEDPPKWPFPARTVAPRLLNITDRKILEKYIADHAIYETSVRDGTVLRSRSAVVRKILNEYFSNHHSK